MRMIRAMVIATAVAAALPTAAAAQKGRGFTDSWFWGIKGGGFALADSGSKYVQAPMAGIDWMITRTHGGLYVSLEQAFFSQHTFTLRDGAAGLDSGLRPILVKNLRKLDIGFVGFPGEHLQFHPYVGGGLTMSQVTQAVPEGPFSNSDQLSFAEQVIDEERAGFTPFLMVGAQRRLSRFSIFGQATLSPAQKNFILYNGKPINVGYEFGLRYNFGSSIDRS